MTDDPIETVRRYAEAKNRDDLDAAMDCWHPRGRFRAVPLDLEVDGREEVRFLFREILDSLQGYEGVLESIYGDGRRVTVRWRLTGTATGSLLGARATGRRLDVPAVSLFELSEGLVATEEMYFDLATVADQADVSMRALTAPDGADGEADAEGLLASLGSR